jgi:hypothetical protein
MLLVGLESFELSTFRLASRCSIHLSYSPRTQKVNDRRAVVLDTRSKQAAHQLTSVRWKIVLRGSSLLSDALILSCQSSQPTLPEASHLWKSC